MKRRVLICGATGFIGRNLTEAFAEDGAFEVVALRYTRPSYELPGVRWIQADLRDSAAAAAALEGIDTVIQCAATTSGAGDVATRPYIHVTDNAIMNSVLFRAAYDQSVKQLVFFSCSVMYHSSETPLKEDEFDANREMFRNYFPAGWTKVYMEKMCEFYSRLGRTRFTVLRHSNIYGPHDKYDLQRSHVFGATVTKVMTAADGKIVVWGEGEEARDLVYISDLVEAVRLALTQQKDPFKLYNVGAGHAVPVKEIVARIIRHSKRSVKVEHDLSKPSFKTTFCLDSSKIKAELGWAPRVGLDEGIEKTLDWYRRNMPAKSEARS
ncbi:MAG: NAD(P)-dependent oxidoreductase [Elusimicrobia bacterium]|nr:NAD(P)-dependent oxidoreductase [Elusimicrobiota bacterium]